MKAPAKEQHLFAYGDREGDGMVQMTFTLKVEQGPVAREAARQFALQHGLEKPIVAAMETCGVGYTYFVVYGHSKHSVALHKIEVPQADFPLLEKKDIEHLIEEKLGRKLIVVGACTGADAHTVGIDAILNMKGYAGDKGLEAYKWIDAHNLGSQVENETLIARATALEADAILVSQVITQRDCHIDNGRELIEMLKKRGIRDRFVMLFGGPRIDHKLAIEIGYDAGFGPGTLPRTVASFLVHALSRKFDV